MPIDTDVETNWELELDYVQIRINYSQNPHSIFRLACITIQQEINKSFKSIAWANRQYKMTFLTTAFGRKVGFLCTDFLS